MTTPSTAASAGSAPAREAFQNPYRASAGAQLDRLVHAKFFPEAANGAPQYSLSEREAARLVVALRKKYAKKVIVGKTNGRPPGFFARLETDPSTSVEALADTQALAICRLAAVLASR